MGGNGIIRNIINMAIKEKGTQSVLADEAGCDGATLSRFLSGEGSIRLDVLEKIFNVASLRIMPESHYKDLKAALRAISRLADGD